MAKGKTVNYLQAALMINEQHIQNLDDAAVSSDVGGIRLQRTAECTACIAQSYLLRYLGVP